MKPIRCLIVDDEPLARQGLEKYVREIDLLHLVGTAKNALQANTLFHQEKVDLFFLDIEMPGVGGLDFLRTLTDPPFVVFTTAYPQYALDSYEFDTVDYLVKPISFERFLQAVNKAVRLMNRRSTDEPDYIFVKTDQRLVKLRTDDIRWIEGQQNYVFIHTLQEKLMVLSTMKNLLETLPEVLLRVHKSYAVAIDHVDAIEGNKLIIGQQHIPLSVRLRTTVVERLTRDRALK